MATSEMADVLIIGSGASGGPFAWSRSKVPGLKIVCLEQGDWVSPPSDNPNAEADGQRQRLINPRREEPAAATIADVLRAVGSES